jgi:hypothetical protein
MRKFLTTANRCELNAALPLDHLNDILKMSAGVSGSRIATYNSLTMAGKFPDRGRRSDWQPFHRPLRALSTPLMSSFTQSPHTRVRLDEGFSPPAAVFELPFRLAHSRPFEYEVA